MSLAELFSGRNVDMVGAAQRLKEVADGVGLPLAPSGMIYNTRLAQEMAKWAESRGRGREIHDAIFRAYFVEARNIGKADELVAVAVSIGLPGDEAREVLEGRAFKDIVDADWERSRALGIRAVPTFVMDGMRLVGFQTYQALERLVSSLGTVRRDSKAARQ